MIFATVLSPQNPIVCLSHNWSQNDPLVRFGPGPACLPSRILRQLSPIAADPRLARFRQQGANFRHIPNQPTQTPQPKKREIPGKPLYCPESDTTASEPIRQSGLEIQRIPYVKPEMEENHVKIRNPANHATCTPASLLFPRHPKRPPYTRTIHNCSCFKIALSTV